MTIIMIMISDSSEEDSAEYTSLTMFLAAIGLHDWAPKARASSIIIMMIMIMIMIMIINNDSILVSSLFGSESISKL